jgi:hypothetical protein
MASLLPECRSVNGRALFLQEVNATQVFLEQLMSERWTLRLNQAVDQLLGRSRYERRAHVPCDLEQVGASQRYASHCSNHFSRNGSRAAPARACLRLWLQPCFHRRLDAPHAALFDHDLHAAVTGTVYHPANLGENGSQL